MSLWCPFASATLLPLVLLSPSSVGVDNLRLPRSPYAIWRQFFPGSLVKVHEWGNGSRAATLLLSFLFSLTFPISLFLVFSYSFFANLFIFYLVFSVSSITFSSLLSPWWGTSCQPFTYRLSLWSCVAVWPSLWFPHVIQTIPGMKDTIIRARENGFRLKKSIWVF